MLSRRAFLAGSALVILGGDVTTLAHRLWRGAVGAASHFHPPYTAAWTRSPSNPILSPVLTWEETAVAEVGAVFTSPWRMWYAGGWANPGLGYATSADGISWTKDAGNPVLGQGGSGLAGPACSPRIVLIGSTLHAYVSSGSPLRSTMLHYTSSDGIAWSAAPLSISLPAGTTLYGNREVWVEGGTWYMLTDLFGSPGIWRIYLYTSPDGETWTIHNFGAGYAIATLAVNTLGTWGGLRFAQINGVLDPQPDGTNYEAWFHAVNGTGNLPTDIYHATCTSVLSDAWTISPGTPVLTHAGSGFEVDQVAGPVPVVVGGTAYLFYDGDDNPASTAKIGMATAAAV